MSGVQPVLASTRIGPSKTPRTARSVATSDGPPTLIFSAGKSLARVARSGLQRVHRGEIAIAQAIEETLVDVTPLLKKRVQILWSIANIATLVGLLGTVVGLIRAFGAVSAAKPEERSALLAKGISEALNNTAMGLGIAVTCIIAHAVLSSASKKQVSDLETFSLKLENLLAESAQGSAKA